jgi:dynein heavy chain
VVSHFFWFFFFYHLFFYLTGHKQLTDWTIELDTPLCIWISGLFNPTAFNTAIMQVTARRDGLPLDNMTIATAVTAMSKSEEVEKQPRNGGRFVHGLYIEGASWMHDEEECEDYDVNGVVCRGYLVDAALKELLPSLPVVYIRAVAVDPAWNASEVGYLRNNREVLECPVYTTTFRGPTFVFLATLRCKEGTTVEQWVLRAVALIMATD